MTKHLPEQLTLFQDIAIPSDTEREDSFHKVVWSYSRRSTFEQCSRKYYNTYFGGNKHTAHQESTKADLHFLKGLSNRFERTGSLVHLAIQQYFRAAQQGRFWDTQRLSRFACKIFQADRAYSRTYPDGTAVRGQKYPPTLLREYHYRQPDAEILCQEAEERLVDALHAFATDSQFAAFRIAGTRPDALIERLFTLSGFPCKVTGKIDLAFRQESQIIIVDWKLGESNGMGSNSLQLATYALWSIDSFGCTPDHLRVCKAHLGSRDVIDFEATEYYLAMARGCIVQDIERMAALQEYGQQGIAESFTPCLQPRICHQCVFERLCYA